MPRMPKGIAVAAALGISIAASAGCATIQRAEVGDREEVLGAAGFHQIPADTKQRIDTMRSLPPDRISMVIRDGKTWYVFPDPDPMGCNCLYVGDEAAYTEARRLAFEKQIADEQMMAAEAMEDATLWGPMGPWGPWDW